LLVVFVSAGVAAAIDVTFCGQQVPAGAIGEVRNDLACGAGSFAAAVQLGQLATLRLNGHPLSGPTAGGRVVDASGSARIEVPGEIDSAVGAWVGVDGASLFMDGGSTGIDVHDCGIGVAVVNGKATLTNVILRDNAGPGAFAERMKATDVTATGNAAQGLNAHNLKAVAVTASGNGIFGLGGDRVLIHGATVDGNGRFGVSSFAGSVSAKDVVITNSGEVGILARKKVVLKDSSVTGTGPGTGDFPPNTDLYSLEKKPKLVDSTCGKSAGPSGTWGVCAND